MPVRCCPQDQLVILVPSERVWRRCEPTPPYNRTHEHYRVRCTILDIERLEHKVFDSVAAITHPSLRCVSQSCPCLRKTTPLSELALEKLPLVSSHTTSVFSCGHLSRRSLSRVRSERVPRRVNRESGI